MTEPKFQIGDDLYVRDPQRFEPGCTSITGKVTAVTDRGYVLAAHIGFPYPRKAIEQPSLFAERDVGLRLGTTLSQLSGRPGHAGYETFKAIAASYGYD